MMVVSLGVEIMARIFLSIRAHSDAPSIPEFMREMAIETEKHEDEEPEKEKTTSVDENDNRENTEVRIVKRVWSCLCYVFCLPHSPRKMKYLYVG